MGNSTSKKSAQSLRASVKNPKITASKMEKDQSNKGISKKIAPFTKGEITSFGFKKKSRRLPQPLTLSASIVPPFQKAKEKSNVSIGNSQKNLSEGYQSGSSIESLCHATFRSTPKTIQKRNDATLEEKQQRQQMGNFAPPPPVNRFGFRQSSPLEGAKDSSNQKEVLQEKRFTNSSHAHPREAKPSQVLLENHNDSGVSKCEETRAGSFNTPKMSHLSDEELIFGITKGMQPKKFTLQTSHLPKPQFPVRVLDQKFVKTAANYHRKEVSHGEFKTIKSNVRNGNPRLESHLTSSSGGLEKKMDAHDCSPGSRVRRRLPTCKGKKLEMKVIGNKFELCDKNEKELEITETSLVKLPHAFSTRNNSTAVINAGLVEERTNQYLKRISRPLAYSKEKSMGCFRNEGFGKTSFESSCTAEGCHESFQKESGEEKLCKDRCNSEKFFMIKDCMLADYSSGEAMVEEEIFSSNTAGIEGFENGFTPLSRPETFRFDLNNADGMPNSIRLDALKLSKELKCKSFSLLDQNSAGIEKKGKIPQNLGIDVQDENELQNDSISEQLSIDSDSFGNDRESKNIGGEKILKGSKLALDSRDLETEIQELNEIGSTTTTTSDSKSDTDIEDNELDGSINGAGTRSEGGEQNNCLDKSCHGVRRSPRSPSKTSQSLSLTDGRDFLIDDEIADQPELCFSEKYLEMIPQEKAIINGVVNGALETSARESTSRLLSKVAFENADENLGFGFRRTEANEKEAFLRPNENGRLNSERASFPGDAIASDGQSSHFEETAERWEHCQELRRKSRSGCGSPNSGCGRPQTSPTAADDSHFVKFEKSSFLEVFEDFVNLKTMLLNLQNLLSGVENEGPPDSDLALLESSSPYVSFENESADLRRQVLFLQQQLEEKKKTVEILKSEIIKTKLFANDEREKRDCEAKRRNAATQTGLDRFRRCSPRSRALQTAPVV